MKEWDHPYRSFLLEVQRPIRYLGGEYGSAAPAGGVTVALAFPDTYEIGMSYLGLHILYDILRREEGIQVERVFAPWIDLEEQLRRRSLPLLTLESRRPLRECDLVGFSLQYELTFTNVLAMLELGGIPLRSADRTAGDPVVIAGGPLAFQPEGMAPFFDAFVLGDGEQILPALVHAVGRMKRGGASREAVLEELASFEGVYVPAMVSVSEDPRTGLLVAPAGTSVRRTPAVDLSCFPFPSLWPVPDTEIVFDRFSVEIARGCHGGCRFCHGGFIYRPVRLRTPQQIVQAVREGLTCCGFDTVSLTSLSTADYPGIGALLRVLAAELGDQSVTLSVSSLRAYDLPEDLLGALSVVRQPTLTFALEAGSGRLRRVINKVLVEEDVRRTAERVFSQGWQRMKLYFMIGLPGETDEDVAAIVEVTRSVMEVARRFSPRCARGVTASVSTLVPKPHTPFQWEAMLPEEEIKRRQRLLYDRAKRHRLSVKWHKWDMSMLEGILGRGDRKLADVIERAYRLGCRFDGWAERFSYDLWRGAFEETGVDPSRYLGPFPLEGRLPWDHIRTGVDPEFLREELKRSREGKVTAACYLTGVCHNCGAACDLPEAPASSGGEAPAPARRVPAKGQVTAFRVCFRRSGRLSYLSQLDLVRTFPRVFRRAGLLLAYSEGHRPRPLMSFPPALPLGATAVRDLVDVRVVEPKLSGREAVEKLNEVAPGGLRILTARALAPWEKKLSRRIRAIDSAVALKGELSENELEERLGGFLDAARAVVELAEGKAQRELDLRTWVYEARIVARLEGMGEELGPFLFLRTTPEARPLLVAEHVLGAPVKGDRLLRLDLLSSGPLGFTSIR